MLLGGAHVAMCEGFISDEPNKKNASQLLLLFTCLRRASFDEHKPPSATL